MSEGSDGFIFSGIDNVFQSRCWSFFPVVVYTVFPMTCTRDVWSTSRTAIWLSLGCLKLLLEWEPSMRFGQGGVECVWDLFCGTWEDRRRCDVSINWEMVRLKQMIPPELELLQAGSEAEEQSECPAQTVQIRTQIKGFCFHSVL